MTTGLFDNTRNHEPPECVTAIAICFLLCAAYLAFLGIISLVDPGVVSMRWGEPLLEGLELAGPYMSLLVAAVGALTGYGLLRMNRWARRTAIGIALFGLVMLIPDVSSAVIEYRMGKLAIAGLGVIVRVMVVWYLYQEQVKEIFSS